MLLYNIAITFVKNELFFVNYFLNFINVLITIQSRYAKNGSIYFFYEFYYNVLCLNIKFWMVNVTCTDFVKIIAYEIQIWLIVDYIVY